MKSVRVPSARISRGLFCFSGVLVAASLARPSAAGVDPLSDGFEARFLNPPPAARPYVWWHWLDGNVTKDGIQRDLEWMHDVGIGGFEVVDVSMGTPALVSPLADYDSPEWRDDLRFAVHTASALGLEVVISSAPGFSESGGPWVRPEEAMKKVVWSVTRVVGGHQFSGRLAEPPSVPGPFQDMPIDRSSLTAGAEPTASIPHLYKDVAVVAYRIPGAEISMEDMGVEATTSGGESVDPRVLWDGDLRSGVSIPVATDGAEAWLRLSLKRPQTIKSITLSVPSGIATPFISDFSKPIGQIEASADGRQFFKVCDIAASIDVQQTISFPAVTARLFRVTLAPRVPSDNPLLMKRPIPPAHRIAEFVLHTVPRVDHIEEKAGYFTPAAWSEHAGDVSTGGDAVGTDEIVDLTAQMASDGSLRWTPPRGQWEIVRFGYSLEGTTNHPVGPGGTGLEMDKLNPVHVRNNFVRYLDAIRFVVGPSSMGQNGVHAMLNDSWEAGAENWTEGLPEAFAARHGYSLIPWLPALTGRILGDTSLTERFLWDFRDTLGELLAENHYRVIAEELHRRGMIHYVESHEASRAFVGDGMAVKRFADVPTGAMWTGGLGPKPELYDADLRESASVSHEAVFVMFRRTSDATSREIPVIVRTTVSTLDGEWHQRFAERSRDGGLGSWTGDADPDIKYYSGTAIYTKTLQVPGSWLEHHSKLELDLGSVHDLAEVVLNGRKLGVLWHPPLPCRSHRGDSQRHQPPRGPGEQYLGEPLDRRRAASRRPSGVHDIQSVSAKLAAAGIGTSGPRSGSARSPQRSRQWLITAGKGDLI